VVTRRTAFISFTCIFTKAMDFDFLFSVNKRNRSRIYDQLSETSSSGAADIL
jgi:hypothetical protein